ncbi:MAG: hypothetical protein ACLTLQ_03540 [[Clostridium] scindens]
MNYLPLQYKKMPTTPDAFLHRDILEEETAGDNRPCGFISWRSSDAGGAAEAYAYDQAAQPGRSSFFFTTDDWFFLVVSLLIFCFTPSSSLCIFEEKKAAKAMEIGSTLIFLQLYIH